MTAARGALAPDDAAALALLASLPGCGPARLRALVAAGAPTAVLDAVRDGDTLALPGVARVLGGAAPAVVAAWRSAARASDLQHVAARLAEEAVEVVPFGAADYPEPLVSDPDPPALLFVRAGGSAAVAAAMDAPRVAIVGTRRCTNYGLDVARGLGHDLAAAGATVVSGLALGIDGAAHEGVLAAGAPPVGVVGSGLDVVYPRRHRRLWGRVADCGVLLSEAALGAPAEPWRFPQRNRIIAGLSQVVVVVESHATGGSMHTVQAAIERGRAVMAVPGSVRSPSSAGTNRLLAEGAAPVLDVDDVLVALSLEARPSAGAPAVAATLPPTLDPVDAAVLAAVDWTPTATDEVLARTGLALGAAAAALTRLEMRGLVRSHGGWWERCGNVG